MAADFAFINGNVPPSTPPKAELASLGSGNLSDGFYSYVITFVYPEGETSKSPASVEEVKAVAASNGRILLKDIPLGGSACTGRKVYRTTAGGRIHYFVALISNNTATQYTDNIADSALTYRAPDRARSSANPFYVLDIATGAVTKLLLAPEYRYTFKHTGKQADGSAGVAGDYVVLMNLIDTMSNDLTAGRKVLIFLGDTVGFTIDGSDIDPGVDGPAEVHLQAVVHSAKIQVTAERKPRM